jgi:branched-chain amino acid transport system permease protein
VNDLTMASTADAKAARTVTDAPAEPVPEELAGPAAGPRRSAAWAPYARLAAFLVLTPLVVLSQVESRSVMYLVNLWLVYSVAVVGFYWVFGLAGRFAFCQTFSMALGAYLSAWATREGLSPWVGLVVALVGTTLILGLVGMAIARADALYFAVGTIAVLELGLVVFRRWTAFTGRDGTVVGIAPHSFLGTELIDDREVFWLLLGILGAVLLLAVFIDRSPLRRKAIAARDIPMVARTLGVRVARLQLMFFVLGSCTAALSGWMLGHWSGVVGIDTFGVEVAIGIFLMLVLGGMHSYWGPVVGAAFYVAVPQVLEDFEEYQSLIYAGLLLVVVILLPSGLTGVVARLRTGRSGAPSAGHLHRRLLDLVRSGRG